MITVIVPIHNTSKYLDKCLNSIQKQIYKNIEVLCIDSSSDNSTQIIDKYVKKDKRFILIRDLNSSYGYKINLGIKLSKGNYISFVDSDDYISPLMYKRTFEIIDKYKLNFVKCDYLSFSSKSKRKPKYVNCTIDKSLYGLTFNSKLKPNSFYDSDICIWSGLYRKSFIIKNKIKLNESEGASFQDTGFFVLTLLHAKKVRYINESYYRYRNDSYKSSTSSKNNVYSIISEFKFIDHQINKNHSQNIEQLDSICFRKIVSYSWNVRRLENKLAIKFINTIKDELKDIYKSNLYEKMPIRIKNYLDEMYFYKNIHNKKVSIVIPVYNVAKYLEKTLESIEIQDYKNIDIICVNDGSTDSSLDILKRYKKIDNRIKIVNQKNQGLSVARNNGVKKITGDYLLFLDGDDMLNAGAIFRLVSLMHKNKVNAIEFDGNCVFENKNLQSTNMSNYFHRGEEFGLTSGKDLFIKYVKNSIWLEAAYLVFFDAKWYKNNGIKFEKGIIYEDTQLWPIIHSKLNKVYQTTDSLYTYNVHTNSIMTNKPTAHNIYSRLICHISNLNLIEKEKNKQFKNALITFDKHVFQSIKGISIRAGFYNTLNITNYKLNNLEINELIKAGVDYDLYQYLSTLIELLNKSNVVEIIAKNQIISNINVLIKDKMLIKNKIKILAKFSTTNKPIIIVDDNKLALSKKYILALNLYIGEIKN